MITTVTGKKFSMKFYATDQAVGVSIENIHMAVFSECLINQTFKVYVWTSE